MSCDLHGFTGVMDYSIGLFVSRNSRAVAGRNPLDVERAFLQHAGKIAGAFANFQCVFGIVPRNRNRGVFSFFVIVSIALILVERELAVRAAINAQLGGIGWFLA